MTNDVFAEVETPTWVGRVRSGEVLFPAGSAADLIRGLDWASTPLGSIEGWSAGLLSALNLILSTRFPMFLTWGDANHLFYNDAYEPVLSGKTGCMGKPFIEVFPEAAERVEPVLKRALAGEATYFEDYHVPLIRNMRLSDTWWSFSYSPLREGDGAVSGVLGVVYETTRRFLAERALRTNEAALRLVTEKAPGLLWRCEPNGRLTWINEKLRTYWAEDLHQPIYWQDRVHPDDRAEGLRVHDDCLRQQRGFECHQRLRGGNGSYRWFAVHAEQVVSSNGEVMSWCGSAVDIHEWRCAADKLVERDKVFQEFSTAETSLMWAADVETRRVEGLSPRFRSVFALSEGETADWDDWVSRVHPDDQPQIAGAFQLVAEGGTVHGKFRATTPEGDVRWFHATAFPVSGEDGAVKRVGGILIDITKRTDPRVYVIDPNRDHASSLATELAREGLRVRKFHSSADIARVAADLLPGVIVFVAMDGGTPIEEVAPLYGPAFHMPWVVVCAQEPPVSAVVRLMKSGASDVICVGQDAAARVAVAIKAVLPASESQLRSDGTQTSAQAKIDALSRREREVFDGLASGGTNKSIARDLGLSPRTVESHRAHMMDRLGVRTLAELVMLAADAQAGR